MMFLVKYSFIPEFFMHPYRKCFVKINNIYGKNNNYNGKRHIQFDPVPAKKFDFEPNRGPRPESGYIGIQNHSDADVVFFKEVSVKPLKK